MLTPLAVLPTSQRGGTAFAAGSVWMAGGDELLRIDPTSGKPVATIRIGGLGKFVFAGAGSIWVSRAAASENGPAPDSSTVRVDPGTNRVVGKVPFGVTFGFGNLWAMDGNGNLLRGDPATGHTTGSVAVQGRENWQPQIAIGFDSVWVASGDKQTVFRVDPRTMQISASIGPLDGADSLLSLGIGFDAVWANANAAGPTGIGTGTGMLYRIDPGSNMAVAAIPVGSQGVSGGYGSTEVAIGAGSVWTGDSDATISRVNPSTGAVVVRRDSSSHEFLAVGYGSVWADDERLRISDWTP